MFLFSCETKDVSVLTDMEKETIKSEISPIMKQIIENSESGNFVKATEPYSDKPGFISISNGRVSDYTEFLEGNKQYFKALSSQHFNESVMNYTFLNRQAVIVTWGGSAQVTMQDGQQTNVDPFAASLVFAKHDGMWKVVYNHESGIFTAIATDSI